MRSSIPGIFAVVVITLCVTSMVRAADPQAYRVDIASTGDGSMDGTLRATSELISLKGTAPVSPFGLIARARGEVDRLKTVLESYGYYQSTVTIKIEGLGLNSGGLADALNALPKDRDARVDISFELGPLYHLRTVTVDGMIPESAAGAFSLKSGTPAVAADVLAAGSRLESTLQEQGYAFAKVDPPVAYEDQTLPVLDVTFRVDAGARVTIGEIRLEGLQRVHEKLVRHRLTLHSGQQYSSSAIEAARHDLLAMAPFAAISVKVGTAVDSTGGVPITFVFRERLRHAVTLNAAYSSDLGGSGGVTWSDRNVFGNAEQLNIAATVLDLGGHSTTGVGYDTTAKFIIPDFGHRDQSLQFALGAIKQSLQAYDQKAITSGVTLTRKLSSVWSASVGVSTADEQIMQDGNACTRALPSGANETIQLGNTTLPAGETCTGISAAEEQILQASNTYNYTLVALPLSLSYDSTHLASPLDDPLHGMRDSLSVTPTLSLGHPSATFIITQVKLAAYFDLNNLGFFDPGRSVLAMRALVGIAQGAGEFSLPPDQRFYGGGSGTIRGYPYQAVGPQFTTNGIPNGNPKGGTAIAAGSLEFRQRFGKNFGAAIFVDGGQVSDTLQADASDFFVGVGAGIRYYTPIGPIRLDVAFPTRRYSNDDVPFEIYIGLGQAF
jgi:translocation and assembly module TamA